MERTWIKIHNGLTNDPKHRERMGNRIWYFMWLCDHADWVTGIVPNHTDAWAAEEMGMIKEDGTVLSRTIEDQRQSLARDGYIRCERQFQCYNIRIMRWRNPKAVEAKQINVPDQIDTWPDYDKSRGTVIPVANPAESSVVPSLDSHESESKGADAPPMNWNDYQQVLNFMNESQNPIGIIGDAFKFLFPAHVPAKPSVLYGRIGKIVKLLYPANVSDLAVSEIAYSRMVKDCARQVLFCLYGISLINPAPADPMDYLHKYVEGTVAKANMSREAANGDLAKLIQMMESVA